MTAPVLVSTAMQSAVAATGIDYATLPKPVGYQILVRLYEPPKKTNAGLYIPEQTASLEKTASIMGYVVSMGPECYLSTATKEFPVGARCAVGDCVMFASYSGVRLKHNKLDYRLINDDTVLAVVPDPDAVERS